jgi:hypothetical protein
MFIIGATLAHIGRLKARFKAIHADTPEEARAIRAGLDRIKLPPRYEYPRRSKRAAVQRAMAAHDATLRKLAK